MNCCRCLIPCRPWVRPRPTTGVQASYRYLIQLRPHGAALSCWRRYPEGIGWQRRCGPMPLAQFVRRFSAPQRASS